MLAKLLADFRSLALLTKSLNHGPYLSNAFNSHNSLNYIFKCSLNRWHNISYNSYSTLLSKNLLKEEKGNSTKSNLQLEHRNISYHHIHRPKPETTKENLRFKVHYPEDGKYTIKRLTMTKLGGRDPNTGRIIFGKIGGGHKRRYRWVLFDRVPPGSKDPRVERVIHVQYDPNRTGRIALVGHDDQLRFIMATANMKAGNLITSTRELPRNPIRPIPGNAYPVGALPFGTMICCVEIMPHGGCIKIAAGASSTVLRKQDDKVVIQVNSRREFALDPNCLATIGQISNVDQNKKPIGSAQRARWLGIRPSSGLWQRKDGRFGFKRKGKEPVKYIKEPKKPQPLIELNITGEGPSRKIVPSTDRVS